MKFLWILAILPTMVLAETYQQEVTLKDSTTLVAIELNDKSVFCTTLGYGTNQLKVSVPDLDWIAHFDHRVVGEGLPCITAGECRGNLQPGKFIDANDPVVLAPVRVVLKQTLNIDDAQHVCTQTLSEDVTSLIRGQVFKHFRAGKPTPLDYAKCLKIQSAI